MKYAQGGIIKPSNATSDSVPVWLDDGGYRIPASVVERLGSDILKRLNDAAPEES